MINFPEPIITPTTKASVGHDEIFQEKKFLKTGNCGVKRIMCNWKIYTRFVSTRTEIAAKKGLILVDTKYEFERRAGKFI